MPLAKLMFPTSEHSHLLLVGHPPLRPLGRALSRAGYSVEHVDAADALGAARLGVAGAVLSGERGEILPLCQRIKERLPAPFLPVLVLLAAPSRLPDDPTAPDAWLAPDTPPRTVVMRVAELLRLRRADAEMVRLNAVLAELAAENGLLYAQARREAEAAATLLRELQHRVRNNLAVIQALLVLERHRQPSRSLHEALDVAIARLRSMSALQDNVAPLTPEVHLASLAAAVARGICEVIDGPPMTVDVSGDALVSPRAASALALVLNELICNARRHANAKAVHVAIEQRDSQLLVSVNDDGRGLPAYTVEGSGLMIARTVARNELGGALELPAPGEPAHMRLVLPLDRLE